MSKCNTSLTSSTRVFMRNKCMPVGYQDKIEITNYIEGDIGGAYADTKASAMKQGSEIEEERAVSFSLTWGIQFKLTVGTYIAEYMSILDIMKKTKNLNIVNNFEYWVITPTSEEYYSEGYMELTQPVFHNVVSKEYINDVTLRANAHPIVSSNDAYTIIGEAPDVENINLTADYNLDGINLDITFDDLSVQFNQDTLLFKTYDETMTLIEEITNIGALSYTTTSGSYTTGESFTIEAYAKTNGYSAIYQVGKFDLVTP